MAHGASFRRTPWLRSNRFKLDRLTPYLSASTSRVAPATNVATNSATASSLSRARTGAGADRGPWIAAATINCGCCPSTARPTSGRNPGWQSSKRRPPRVHLLCLGSCSSVAVASPAISVNLVMPFSPCGAYVCTTSVLQCVHIVLTSNHKQRHTIMREIKFRAWGTDGMVEVLVWNLDKQKGYAKPHQFAWLRSACQAGNGPSR